MPRKREEILNEKYIIGLIVYSPTLHLGEIVTKVSEATGIEISVPTICKLLARHGFTGKKVKQVVIFVVLLWHADISHDTFLEI